MKPFKLALIPSLSIGMILLFLDGESHASPVRGIKAFTRLLSCGGKPESCTQTAADYLDSLDKFLQAERDLFSSKGLEGESATSFEERLTDLQAMHNRIKIGEEGRQRSRFPDIENLKPRLETSLRILDKDRQAKKSATEAVNTLEELAKLRESVQAHLHLLKKRPEILPAAASDLAEELEEAWQTELYSLNVYIAEKRKELASLGIQIEPNTNPSAGASHGLKGKAIAE